MTDTICVEKIDEVWMRITAEPSIRYEIMNYFSFQPNNFQFSPKYKNKVWDGYIRLYTPLKPYLYVGLLPHLKTFCKERQYEIEYVESFETGEEVDENYGYKLAKTLPSQFELRDYQNQYVIEAIRNGRSISKSPTSSGKSLIIYLIQKYYRETYGLRTLIIVPRISLVHQMAGDFVDYGESETNIYKIQGGIDKKTQSPIVVSTYQSLATIKDKSWFEQFGVVLGDEAHLFQANSLKAIMETLIHCKYRHGFTGTLKKEEMVTHQMVLEGVFGSVNHFISTKDLIQSGTIANLTIKGLILNHTDEDKTLFRDKLRKIEKEKKKHYAAEREFLVENTKRTNFVVKLGKSFPSDNILILFDLVEKQGKVLYELLRKDREKVHFIYGGISGEDRESIRHMVENDPDKGHIIVASYGTFSTGVNIKRLDKIIFATGSKSEIRVLQSIGRSLRKGKDSESAVIYDIADNLSRTKSPNYTLQHFQKRLEIYAEEQFPFKIYNIDL